MNKRGLLVGVLLSILLLTALSFAEETKPTTDATKAKELKVHGVDIATEQIYTSFTIGCDNCGDGIPSSCGAREVRCDSTKVLDYYANWHVTCASYKKGNAIKLPRGDDFEDDYDGCGSELTDLKYKKQADKGCWIFVSETEGAGSDDECGLGQVTEGFIIDYSPAKQFAFVSGSTTTWEYGDSPENPSEEADPQCMLQTIKWQLNSNSPLICGFDHYWHSCTGSKDQEKGDLNSVTWANNHFYSCTKNKDTNDNPIWKDLGQDKDQDLHVDNGKDDCEFYDLKQNPPLCQELETLTDCKNDKKYAVCAQCINKDASEIAGDGKDNNCDGKDVTDPDQDEKSCTDKNLNLDDKSYFWMPDAKKNEQCCGDDADDFGKIFETTSGERLCLKKDPKSVGSIGKVEEIAGKTSCNSDWCAPEASNDNVDFHIFTLKQPGKEAYDVVSNGDIWQKNFRNQ